MKRFFVLIGCLAFVAAAYCQTGLPTINSETADGQGKVFINFQSSALAKGSQKVASVGQLVVQLPPSYASQTAKRYPVVYCFHGYGDPVDEMLQAVAPILAKNPDAPEAILVAVSGYDTFYHDSAVRGGGESLVLQEAIPLIDSKFRTLATASGRMLAGFSMGGYGAWNLALTHPELFCAAWAVCPGAFDQNGLKDALTTWDARFFGDYAAAFAPEKYKPNIRRAAKPSFDQSDADRAYVQALDSGFGGIEKKLSAYSKGGAKLKALRFDYGSLDGYDWIPRGTQYLAEQCAKAGIVASSASHQAGHQITQAMVETGFLPLFRQVFGK